jgi:hypothetical protein
MGAVGEGGDGGHGFVFETLCQTALLLISYIQVGLLFHSTSRWRVMPLLSATRREAMFCGWIKEISRLQFSSVNP